MKPSTYLIWIIFLLFPTLVNAQDFLSNLKNDYQDCDECTILNLEGNLMGNLFEAKADDDEISSLLKNVRAFQLISIPKAKIGNKTDLEDIKKLIKKARYEDLISFKEKDSMVNLMVHEKNGILDQLILLSDNSADFLVISLSGNFDRKSAKKIMNGVKWN